MVSPATETWTAHMETVHWIHRRNPETHSAALVTFIVITNPRKHVFILRGIYQDAVQVGYVDDLTESFNALNEFAEVVDHLFSLDDLGISRESGWEEALVNQRSKTHHDWVICKNHGVKVCGIS